MISKIYYINLDRRIDRKENMEKELKKINYKGPVERISAVDGRTLDLPNLSRSLITEEGIKDASDKTRGLYWVMTKGAIGCALSHHNLANKIIEEIKDNDYVLIVEDDIEFQPDFLNKVEEYTKEIPPFDILFLGYHYKHNKKEGNSYYDQPLKSWGTFGFITNKKGSQELLKLFPITNQVDTEMHKLYNNDNLRVFCLKEKLKLVLSPQSQADTQHGTDIQVREAFQNIIKNSNPTILLYFIVLIILILFI